jgi:hypothetical protein
MKRLNRLTRVYPPCTPTLFRLFILVSTCFLALLSPFQTGLSQDANTIQVQAPVVDNFPILTVEIKLDKSVNLADIVLKPEQIAIIENQKERTILSLRRIPQGAHFTLAVNGSRDFDIRDAEGRSPYIKISSVIENWAETRKFKPYDTWSFVSNEGIGVQNINAPEGWLTAFTAYEPNFRAMEPNLASLERALQLAEDRIVPFGVDKALLYLTPPLTPEQIEPLNALTQKAVIAGIRVHVWMVGDPYFLTNEQGGALVDLAEISGGQFYYYTEEVPLPDPESMLEPLGVIYSLNYESGIRASGSYPLEIEIDLPTGVVSGESLPFYIDVLPPKPILICPPMSITLPLTRQGEDIDGKSGQDVYDFNILIEFPDGYTREIVASRLFVDGALVDEKTAAPFNHLFWNLTSISESGEHIIEVEVEDSLGLASRTIPTPIQVDLRAPQVIDEGNTSRQEMGLWISGIIFATALLILLGWSIRQFVKSPSYDRLKYKWVLRSKKITEKSRLDIAKPYQVYASLVPIDDVDLTNTANHIFVEDQDVIFGSDPEQAGVIIDDPIGVGPCHARLRSENNTFWISDFGSTEGTWVNYDRIGLGPVKLKPGDILYFGTHGYRFIIENDEFSQDITTSQYKPIL